MAHLLRLQISKPDEKNKTDSNNSQTKNANSIDDVSFIVPNLNNTIDICFDNEKYYLVLSEQLIPLQNGALLQGEDFSIKVKQETTAIPETQNNITDAPAAISPGTSNVNDHLASFIPEFDLTELNKENNYLELNTLISAENSNDELAFLFKGNASANTRDAFLPEPHDSYAEMTLSGKDPLSLLNQHFQPPEPKTPAAPITIGQPTDLITGSTLTNEQGNILHDLGFPGDNDHSYQLGTYANAIAAPTPSSSAIGYKEDKYETELNSLESPPPKTNDLPIIKKLWQKFLAGG